MAGNVKISVELADTPTKQAKGLMYRKCLDKDSGMFFKFRNKKNQRFWMKNTYIPLDIAFIDDNGMIFQIAHMYPLSLRSVESLRPCRYALEVNQGWFSNKGIKAGSYLRGLVFPFSKTAQSDLSNMGNPQPTVDMEMSIEDQLEYAEQRGLPINIIYRSKKGFTLPPRKIMPLPSQYGGDSGKYLVEHGPSGKLFKAFDVSPTIEGPDYTIEGGQVKSYLFDGIVNLDIIGLDDQPIDVIRGVPTKSPEETPDEIYDFDVSREWEVYEALHNSVPALTVDKWELMKDDIKDMISQGRSILEITDYVRSLVLQTPSTE